jgi:gluconate 5-dehydrogenase
MERQLEGKKVLITGASSGIGKAIAILFAKEGADLCLVARRAEELSKVAEQCRAVGVKVLDLNVDITEKTEVEKWP